jgi:hypothetical protein
VTVTYSDAKKKEFEEFQKNGGTIIFEIDAEDISESKDFETSPDIQPKLGSGFELPPSTIIHSAEAQAQVLVYGSPWTIMMTDVYRRGGRIIYKQKTSGKYEATCSVTTG